MDRFSKLYIALKFRLYGMNMLKAMVALEKAREIHTNLRKDGVTPELQHQLEIALHILTLKDVPNLEECVITALLHDSLEDYPSNELRQWAAQNLEHQTQLYLDVLNKNNSPNEAAYIAEVAKSPVTAIVKLCDRVHNFQSMHRGKFSKEKQQKYYDEVITLFLPMAKQARLSNPQYMDLFYNLELMLKSQAEFVKIILDMQTS